jgi:membrane protease subunit (stomatin/prohibitin family)
MSIFGKLRGEFIDIIEWMDSTQDTMVYRFQRQDHEILNGAKLVVREGQTAVFVSEGQLADVFLPGTHTLATQNLPVLAKLKGWKYGFNSPFKAEVYFISTRIFTDRKWGTKNPIMMRDSEFGPVRLRAFGSFSVRVKYPPVFIRELVGTNGDFTVEDVDGQLRDMVGSRFATALGQSGIAVLDLAGNYDALGQIITDRIQPDFATFGLEVIKLLVENISLPAEVEAAMDKRSSMGVIGNLSAFTQYQTAQAIPDAAKNPSGLAGASMGLGAGYVMGQQLGNATAAALSGTVGGRGDPAAAPGRGAGGAGTQPSGGSDTEAPPALPTEPVFFAALDGQQAGPFDKGKLKELLGSGKLTRETMVWSKGMAGWASAGSAPGLASLFAEVPPPVPKA